MLPFSSGTVRTKLVRRKETAKKFSGGSHTARAKYCVSQSELAKDEKIKKFWDGLVDEWMAMHEQAVADSGLTEKTGF